VGTLELPNNLATVDRGVPFPMLNQTGRILLPDANQDGTIQLSKIAGTPDDQNHDGTSDYDNWKSGPDVKDPWVTFQSEGPVLHGVAAMPCGTAGTPCQPNPFYDPGTNKLGGYDTNFDDHSNIFANVPRALCPEYDYSFWKGVALGGGANIYYYKSDGVGTGTYKLVGTGPSVDFRTAVHNQTGFFFFDTATNSVPVDANGDGTFDNLSATSRSTAVDRAA
jgi:hypothetical protein